MAVALRPAVILIALASLLFLLAGWLDAAAGISQYSSFESYLFGAINMLVAISIARGNERILALRIGLAAFFMFERPVTAVAFGPKPLPSIGVHLVTALVEAVILAQTMRVWRLGHSVTQSDLAFLSLPGAPSPLAVAAGTSAPAEPPLREAGPIPAPRAKSVRPKGRRREPRPAPAAGTWSPRPGWAMGLLALLLALALVGDAVAGGVAPGVTVDLASPDLLGYVLALVVLVVAARAVHQGSFAVRLLLVVSLVTFVERAFTPFALGRTDAASLGLHGAAALLALGLAILSTASLSASRPRSARPAPPV